MTARFQSRHMLGLYRSSNARRRWANLFLSVLAALLPVSVPASAQTADSTLLTAKNYVTRWLAALPDIVCRQTTERSTLDRRQMWRRDEVSQAELTVEQGVERYRLLSVNGTPVNDMQSSAAHLRGSGGEFLSAVRRLFDPASKAEFRRRGEREEHGRKLCRYDFRILQANSQWYVGADPGYRPAYSGSIWVDKDEGSPSRIDMEARAFPSSVAVRRVTMRTTFDSVTINGEPHLVPNGSEVVVFANWGYAERRVIGYSDYRRFSAASRVVAGGPE